MRTGTGEIRDANPLREKARQVHWCIWTALTSSSHRRGVVAASSRRRRHIVAPASVLAIGRFPFARKSALLWSMTESTRPRLVRKKKLRFYGGRGPVYAWLRTHHDEIQPLRGQHLNLWAELALDMVDDRVATPADGRSLRDKIRQAWLRVERDVETAAASAKPKPVGAKYPSRIPADWRPQTVTPPPPVRTIAPILPKAVALVPAVEKAADTEEGLEEIDRAFAQLEADDRRKFRFGG